MNWRRNRIGAGAALVAVNAIGLFGASASPTPGAVLCDDFDDNVIGDLWRVIEPEPSVISVAEDDMRLEFTAEENPGVEAGAALVGADWAIAATADFRLTVSAHRDIPEVSVGDIGLEVILAFNVDLDGEELGDGLSAYLGRNEDGPYLAYEVTRGGGDAESGLQLFAEHDASFFFWYDAAADVLFLSPVAYFDPDAIAIDGLRAGSGSDRVRLLLSAFTEGEAPAVPGDDLFLDAFCIDAGEIVALCPADLDGDGDVGFDDLVMLLAAWGNQGGPEDIDGNGVVEFTDLVLLLAAWGPCP